jgi:N-methylhydantoinase B
MPEQTLNPVTVATIWHSLQTSCREMRHIIERTAQNYLIGQLQDVSVGIWRGNGDTVAMAQGLPSQFLGTRFAIRSMIARFGDNLKPGDIILTNDPYNGGHNCHLPDWGFFRPIFHGDELLFFTLARAHMQDTGGSFPGGYFPNAYDIHAEGMCIPPIKVYEEGRERTDVLELIWNNVRWPRGVRVDNYAMIAATAKAEERVHELIRRYGPDEVMASVDEMIERTEAAVREQIRAIPDGTYHGEASTDDDGTELDVPVTVRVEITVEEDEMTLDFSASDDQRKGFVNSIYAQTYGMSVASAILVFDPALASYHNEGTLRPMTVVAREGSVCNCQYPATVGASPVNVGTQIMEAVLQALSTAVPSRAIASWGKHRGDYTFATDPRTGQGYVSTSFDYDGSGGAVAGHDGYAASGNITTLGIVNRGNVEELENRIPWRILHWEFEADHTGDGKWRGGPGVLWKALNEGGDGQMATGSSDGDEMQGFGALGGHPSPKSRTWIVRGDEEIRVKPHRLVEVKTNDVVVKRSSGGGGVGDPRERDPGLVRKDVLNGVVSPDAARTVYGVDVTLARSAQ